MFFHIEGLKRVGLLTFKYIPPDAAPDLNKLRSQLRGCLQPSFQSTIPSILPPKTQSIPLIVQQSGLRNGRDHVPRANLGIKQSSPTCTV